MTDRFIPELDAHLRLTPELLEKHNLQLSQSREAVIRRIRNTPSSKGREMLQAFKAEVAPILASVGLEVTCGHLHLQTRTDFILRAQFAPCRSLSN